MFRYRILLGLLAVLALVIGACGDGEAPDAGADANDKGAEKGQQDEPPKGVAATVDGEEISDKVVDQWFAEAAKSPQVATQLEGDQGEQLRPVLRAQILSRLIVSAIVLRAADDEFGIKPTKDDVAQRRAELVDEAGGEEQLAQQLGQAGMTEQLLVEHELPLLITLEAVQEEVAPDNGGGPTTTTAPAPGEGQPPPDEGQAALQEWGLKKFAAADVSVRSEYGTWNPQSGEVQPPGGVPTPPGAPAPAPPPGPAPPPPPPSG